MIKIYKRIVTVNSHKCNRLLHFSPKNDNFAFNPLLKLESTINERPIPVILIGGEMTSTNVWNNTTKKMVEQGYSVFATTFPLLTDIDDIVNSINTTVVENKLIPPIVICHSFSTFAMQKYLESYAVSAVVMINPLPPAISYTCHGNIKSWAVSFLNHYQKCRDICDKNDDYSLPAAYYKEDASTTKNFGQYTASKFPTAFLEKLIIGGSSYDVHLEKGVVPLLVIYTQGHLDLIGQGGMTSFLNYHGVHAADVWSLDEQTLCPMGRPAFSQVDMSILQWLEDNV